MRILALVFLTALLPAPALSQLPDFSGSWRFDQPKSMRQPGPDGRVVLAAMLGEEFVAVQDPATLALTIRSAGQTLKATYKLDGTESVNVSPGDIPVRSRASWDGDRLVIRSTSTSTEKGAPITIETKRVIWLEKSGDLIIERTGTPASAVTPSRSALIAPSFAHRR